MTVNIFLTNHGCIPLVFPIQALFLGQFTDSRETPSDPEQNFLHEVVTDLQ